MNSLAIVTRAYDAEAPYIESFISYYQSIGIDEFHIVVPKANSCELLKEVCAKYVNIYWYTEYDSLKYSEMNGVQSVPLPYVKATHILSVDIDEYLYVDNVKELTNFDYVALKWIIAPYQDSMQSELASFPDKQGKYIVRTNLCKRLFDHHAELTTSREQSHVSASLIHYIYRSFNDVYLKCAMSSYGDYQHTEQSQFKAGLNCPLKLPLKFKMAALYRRLTFASKLNLVPNFCKINYELESKLVSETHNYQEIRLLKLALRNYESRIDLAEFFKLLHVNKYFLEYGRLPHFVLSTIADETLVPELIPEEWFSQSGFINKVRKFLSGFNGVFNR